MLFPVDLGLHPQIAHPPPHTVLSPRRPSMSGLNLTKRGREHRKTDLQRDFTVASPAEFIARFGGTRVIEKVAACLCLAWLLLGVHSWVPPSGAAVSLWRSAPVFPRLL